MAVTSTDVDLLKTKIKSSNKNVWKYIDKI